MSQPVIARTTDGVELALHRAPAATPRLGMPPLLMVHGTFSNRNFFLGSGDRGLARYLAARGVDAWVAELRGHGRSGPAGESKSWNFEHWIRNDAPALIDAVRQQTGSRSVVWLGHSAGGAIGAAFAGLNEPLSSALAALIMIGTPAPTRPGAWHVPLAAIGYGITRVVGRFPARALGIGPSDEHAGIMSQWLGWNVRGRWAGADDTDYLANLKQAKLPVLAIAGSGDFLAPPSACRRLLDAFGSADRSLIVCGRRSGFSRRYTHNRLIISEPARREVWPVISDWLEQRFP